MSWSVDYIGTPDGISKKLDEYGAVLTHEPSKEEFLAAKPHLQGLLNQSYGQSVRLRANGHANFKIEADGSQTKVYGNCFVSLEGVGEFCQ